jgi:hypothetical protein
VTFEAHIERLSIGELSGCATTNSTKGLSDRYPQVPRRSQSSKFTGLEPLHNGDARTPVVDHAERILIAIVTTFTVVDRGTLTENRSNVDCLLFANVKGTTVDGGRVTEIIL